MKILGWLFNHSRKARDKMSHAKMVESWNNRVAQADKEKAKREAAPRLHGPYRPAMDGRTRPSHYSASQPRRRDDSLPDSGPDYLNPANPLSPLSPFSVYGLGNSDTPSTDTDRERDRPAPTPAPAPEP
jgi:hypothetical protein